MIGKQENLYSIPARYRKLENLHIVFWLFKDISWCMFWRELGIAMIVPTLAVAIYISYRTRNIKAELAHNLAVAFWIFTTLLPVTGLMIPAATLEAELG